MFKLMKIAVLSDIHGNMEAFREVVKYLEKEQIKKETAQIITKVFSICNGDLSKGIIKAFEDGIINGSSMGNNR